MSTGKRYYEELYQNAEHIHHHSYIFGKITSQIKQAGFSSQIKILDLGCGNGSLSASLANLGYDVTGVDSSKEGIAMAKKHYPSVRFACSDFNTAQLTDKFDVVLAAEVIEHLYEPRLLIRCAKNYLVNGGLLILTTPYHGYLKNLTIAALGRCDSHYNPLWDDGHIKFFSPPDYV